MRNSILSLIVISTFHLACAAELSESDARALWSSVEDTLVDGSNGRSSSGQALTVSTSTETQFDAACDDGGEIEFDGVLSTTTTIDGLVSTATAFDYDATYDDCADEDNLLNGDVAWSSSVNVNVGGDIGAEVLVVYSYQGTIVVEGETNGVCDFDLEGNVLVSANDSGVFVGVSQRDETDYEGTLCGHDAEDVLDVDVVVDTNDDT
jgi:hypothetical protein